MKKICTGMITIFLLAGFGLRNANAWIAYYSNLPAGYEPFLDSVLLKYQYQPKLNRGFANASAYASHVATQRGYQGYDKFMITIGTMPSAQVPATTTNLNYYKHLGSKLIQQGDVYAGVGWNAWALSVGVKLPLDMYISAKFGKLKYSFQSFDFDYTNAGGMFNYQIVKPVAPPVKFVLWRGLSVGTGFIWQYNQIAYYHHAAPMSASGFTIKPTLRIFARTETFLVPLELTTSIRLFWVINIHAGAGIDFAWGSSRLNYSSTGLIAGPTGVGVFSFYGKQGGRGPKNFLPKIMCGPGLSLGPVVIDVPFTYYFIGGFNVGVTLGIVW